MEREIYVIFVRFSSYVVFVYIFQFVSFLNFVVCVFISQFNLIIHYLIIHYVFMKEILCLLNGKYERDFFIYHYVVD